MPLGTMLRRTSPRSRPFDPQDYALNELTAPDYFSLTYFEDNPKSNYAITRIDEIKSDEHSYSYHGGDSDRRITLENLTQCRQFLIASHAVKTPTILYALWVEMYERTGGTVHLMSHTTYYEMTEPLMPTQVTDLPIPTAYGPLALNLLILPTLGAQSLSVSSGDRRDGWEYGHGEVFAFQARSRAGMSTYTNAHFVDTYPEVEALRKGMKHKSNEQLALDVLGFTIAIHDNV